MRIKTHKSVMKYLIGVIGIIALIIAGGLYYMHHFQVGLFAPAHQKSSPTTQKQAPINYQKPTSDQQSAGTAIKKGVVDQNGNSSSSSTSNSNTVAMDITGVNKDATTLYVRAVIQTLSSDGTCTLTMTGPGKYSATAGVQAMASSSTCKGFNVPLSSLPSGTWKVTITFTDGSQTGTASRENVQV